MTLPRPQRHERPSDILPATLVPKQPPKRFLPSNWSTVKIGLGIFALGYFSALVAVILMAYGHQDLKEFAEPFHYVALIVMLGGGCVMLAGYQQK